MSLVFSIHNRLKKLLVKDISEENGLDGAELKCSSQPEAVFACSVEPSGRDEFRRGGRPLMRGREQFRFRSGFRSVTVLFHRNT